MRSYSKFLVSAIFIIWAGGVFAHPGHSHDMVGFSAGFNHPFGGIDHILSMLVLGLFAGYKGRKSLLLVPIVSIATMAIGTVIAISGFVLPFTEIGILLALIVGGLLLAFRVKLSLPFLLPLISLFSICNGYAHGMEMPLNAKSFEYSIGLVTGSSLLLFVGILLSSTKGRDVIVSYLGAAIAFVGMGLLVI